MMSTATVAESRACHEFEFVGLLAKFIGHPRNLSRSFRASFPGRWQLATPQPRRKRQICEPDIQAEREEDRAEEDAVSRSRNDGEQAAEERRRLQIDKSPSARPATQLGANRLQSVLHPVSIGAMVS